MRRVSPSSADDRSRHERPDPVVGHQRATARLAARDAVKLEIDVVQHSVEVLDEPQRHRDLLHRRRRQLERGELLARVAALEAAEAPRLDGDAVVKKHSVDALQPLGALTDKRFAQANLDAQVKDVRRRDPGLGQAVLRQQLAQQPRVEFTRRFRSCRARVSAGSASLTSIPARVHSSATKRHPVIASTATTVGVFA
jgi:hypothetical protein